MRLSFTLPNAFTLNVEFVGEHFRHHIAPDDSICKTLSKEYPGLKDGDYVHVEDSGNYDVLTKITDTIKNPDTGELMKFNLLVL